VRQFCDHNGHARPPEEISRCILDLWASDPIQSVFLRRNEFQLNDSAEYFLSDVNRFCDPENNPNDQDVLRTRVKTTGIVMIEFQVEKMTFNMFDVGGQRSERKKWIHCFDKVTAVLFVISLSEYDQV
jgi:hypothetical protein